MNDEVREAYACAIGNALLALNDAESELFTLLEQLVPADAPALEREYFSTKLEALRKYAVRMSPSETSHKLLRVVADGKAFNSDRNNFAHSLLWHDPWDGTHQRRFVPRATGEPLHDARTPDEIRAVARRIDEFADTVAAIATQLRAAR